MTNGTASSGAAPLPATGFLTEHSNQFYDSVADMNQKFVTAMNAMKANPSDPGLIATYQSTMGEYLLYRSVQSNSNKALKDAAMAIANNLR